MIRAVFTVAVAVTIAGCARPHTALERAAARGDVAHVEQLIANGASAAEIQSALVWAAREGRIPSIPVLIRHGADPNATAGVNGWTVLMHAVHKNRPESVVALIRGGADPNRHGAGGGTPLAMAAGYGYTEIVNALLAHGADPYVEPSAMTAAINGTADIDRWTAGHCQADTVRALLDRAPGLARPDLVASTAARLEHCPEVRDIVIAHMQHARHN